MTNAEIQVGEYVRTKNKGIKRIDHIEDNRTVNKYLYFIGYDHNDREYGIIKTTEIVNHSFNIIDLIEVGDYVKLYVKLGNKEYVDNISSCVCNVGKSDGKSFIELDYGQDGTEFLYNADRIKTIVTKEQFKAMEYKIGGKDD